MGMASESIEKQRARCEEGCEMLRELTRIHLEIDPPKRRIRAEEPDWIFRLRKVCLHAVAITRGELSVDTAHVMATELRAAYVQMDAVWNCVPGEFRLDEMDDGWWAHEARTGLLATYDHPTPLSLAFPLANGGFGDIQDPKSYLRLAVWLGHLGLGYGLALAYLAQVLSAKGDVVSRIVAEFVRTREMPES